MAREKKCPQCAELVKADAKICRFCAHLFPEVTARPSTGMGKKLLIGFGGLLGLGVLAQIAGSGGGSNLSPSASKIDIDPQRKAKGMAAYLAKQAVTTSLKDPASADFGNVWGMSPGVACGLVNAKNSFGAMSGSTRFIYSSGRVEFEKTGGAFPKRWNATCMDKPSAPAPTGPAGMQWGSKPTSRLKLIAPATSEGLAEYVPVAHPAPLEGVPVAEAGYSFEHKKLFSADFFIDGESGHAAILAALVKKYGTPQEYDEVTGVYKWKWPDHRVSVRIYLNPKGGRTTVSYSRD
jgi:hypothetical protein